MSEEHSVKSVLADKRASAEHVVGWTDIIVHWTALGTVIVLAVLAVFGLIALVIQMPSLLTREPFAALETLFSGILLLFILLELYQIGGLYFRHESVIDKVFEVGIVALVRELIVAEFLHYSVQQLLAIAVLVLSLGISWYFTRRTAAARGPVPGREDAAGSA